MIRILITIRATGLESDLKKIRYIYYSKYYGAGGREGGRGIAAGEKNEKKKISKRERKKGENCIKNGPKDLKIASLSHKFRGLHPCPLQL